MVATWRIFGTCLVISAFGLVAIGPALAGSPSPEPQDQVVLSGRVVVAKGEAAGEVIVFHGRVSVAGVVRGDVVVLDGPIEVTGQVGGAVVALNGRIRIGSGAQVGGDVLAGETVTLEDGARIGGTARQYVTFNLRGPIRAAGRFAVWLAMSVSTLVLGLLLLWFVPRGADAVVGAARSAPWATAGWGVGMFLLLPVFGALALISLVGLPLGLLVLLALGLLYLVGFTWAAHVVGSALLKPPRGRAVAFLAGWAVLSALTLIPVAGGGIWALGAVYGSGAMTVATWRARGGPGRHRERRAPAPTVEPTTLAEGPPEVGVL